MKLFPIIVIHCFIKENALSIVVFTLDYEINAWILTPELQNWSLLRILFKMIDNGFNGIFQVIMFVCKSSLIVKLSV